VKTGFEKTRPEEPHEHLVGLGFVFSISSHRAASSLLLDENISISTAFSMQLYDTNYLGQECQKQQLFRQNPEPAPKEPCPGLLGDLRNMNNPVMKCSSDIRHCRLP
jgi:hypothetical protein